MFKAIGGREGIRKCFRNSRNVMEIDTDVVSLWGIPYRDLGAYGKRRFENLVFLENQSDVPVFCYKP